MWPAAVETKYMHTFFRYSLGGNRGEKKGILGNEEGRGGLGGGFV